MRQGEVRWCAFARPSHQRPAVILTRESLIAELNAVTVAPLTTKQMGIDSRVRLDESDGIRQPSEVNLHNLQTVSKDRVGGLISTLSPDRMREINAAIAFSLGFDRFD